MRFVVFILVACCALSASAEGARAAQVSPDTLAMVGEAVVYADDFERGYANRLTRTGEADTRGARHRHLADVLDAYRLAQEAERRGVTSPGLAMRLDLDRRVLARDSYFERMVIDSLGVPTEADLRRAYARNEQQVVARQLAFSTRAEAEAAHTKLESGTPFLILAQALTDAPGDSLAGWVGPVGYYGDVDPALAEALFALPAGAYSAPVRSRSAWHVLYAERWITNPILAEDQFQQRRASIAGLWRERRRMVAGDAFVRRTMEALDVRVEADAVRALGALLNETAAPEPAQTITLGDRGDGYAVEDAERLAADVSPDAVLATYAAPDGSRRAFTVAEYLSGLPALPAEEARARTGASVGRALRDAVFAERGLGLGLDQTPAATRRLAHQQRLRRATLLRATLRDTSATPPPDSTLRALAQARGLLDRRTRLDADLWAASFATHAEADAALAMLRTGRSDPADLPGYARYDRTDAAALPYLRTHIARAPLGTPLVVGVQDGTWRLVQVDRRDAITADFADLRPALIRALTPYAAEVRLLADLRAREGAVEIREAVFERLLRAPFETDASADTTTTGSLTPPPAASTRAAASHLRTLR